MSYITTPDGVTFGTGSRIRAHADSKFLAHPIGSFSLSGMQRKVVASRFDPIDVTGTVIHVKGNDPTNPSRVWVYLKVESTEFPVATEECNTKHPGVMESVFEYFDHIKIDVLKRVE